MEIQSLLKDCKIVRVMNAVAAGTSDQNSSVVDTQGWDGVCFIAAFGTLTATQVTLLKAQHGDASNLSDAADITGAATAALADGDSNKLAVVDVRRPVKRYARAVVDRGTANAVIDGVIAILYRGDTVPVAADGSIAASAFAAAS
jgi:hypothetical protein